MKTKKILILAPRHYIDDLKSYYQPKRKDITVAYYDSERIRPSQIALVCDELLSRDYDGYIGLVDWTAILASHLNHRAGKKAPNTRLLARFQDKLLSRKLQQQYTGYKGVSLSAKHTVRSRDLPFPLFAKPRRASMSYMAGELTDTESLGKIRSESMQQQLRRKNIHWQALYHYLDMPKEILDGLDDFVVESLLPQGLQVTLDGFVQHNTVRFFGFTKSVFMPNHISFKRFDYPYKLSWRLQRKVQRHAKKLILKSGLDHTLFNIEYKVDPSTKSIALVELNTRPSSQFLYPIYSVTGIHPLDIAIDITLGDKVSYKPAGTLHKMASVCVLRRTADAEVALIPTAESMSWLVKHWAKARWKAYALPGQRLSDFPNDSRTYRYAEITVPHSDLDKVTEYEDMIHERVTKAFEFRDHN